MYVGTCKFHTRQRVVTSSALWTALCILDETLIMLLIFKGRFEFDTNTAMAIIAVTCLLLQESILCP